MGGRFTGLDLDDDVAAALVGVLPQMAERTVAAVTVEVPSYTDAFSGRMGQNIENAVQMALGAFLRFATRAEDSDAGAQLSPALDGAYELGRGEARQGRSIDALLSAYRVGARVAWRELSTTAVAAGLPAATIARFAELVFAFIDGRPASPEMLSGRRAWVGPARPWTAAQASYRRAVQSRNLLPAGGAEVVDTDEHLVELVLGADRDAAADLRRRALAPLAGLRPNTAERLTETLRSWLLHQGQRDAVAADLFVHAQTVRYRMTQLREHYGDRFNDPRMILELTVALGVSPPSPGDEN